MINTLLAAIALVLVALTAFPVFIVRATYLAIKGGYTDYMYAIAIGLDQLGGSYLYGKPDWTVSSYTHALAKGGSMTAYRFRDVIDFFFGEHHCRNAYNNELLTHKKELKQMRGRREA